MFETPPCQQCRQPLRWVPEQNAWGCDHCRQMFRPYATHTAAPPAGLPTMQTRASRKGLWIGIGVGVLVVGGIVAGVVASQSNKARVVASGSASGTGSASAVLTDPTPPPPEPAIPSTGIAECDKVAQLRAKVEKCAGMPDEHRQSLLSMADNNLSAADGATGDYAEYVRPKCAGTADYLADQLASASCAPRARAQATGYSVPVPAGWKEIHEDGQRPNELILEQLTPDLGATTVAGMFLELGPYDAKGDATGTADNCKSFAEYVARNAGAILDEQGIVETKIGPGCLNRVHDDREHRLGMQVTIGGGQHTLGATCTYDLAASTHPAGCVEIVDGLTLD